MKVLTYLGLTLLSILIQFCVMDFIEEQMKKNKALDLKTNHKEANSVLRNITHKPHALYFQKNFVPSAKLLEYTNSSITESFIETTTSISSSVIDVFYDENATTVDYTSTESVTTTEIDNVTEFTLFEKTNTTIKPKILPKNNVTISSDSCYCNLMFKVCDINCCCDADCTESDKKLFDCTKVLANLDTNNDLCFLSQPFKLEHSNTVDFIENLFCVAKTNLPEKRNVHLDKVDTNIINKVYKWTPNLVTVHEYTFTKKTYTHNDPMWLYQNGSIFYFELPSKAATSYCASKVPLMFLENKKTRCNVKLEDLEMFRAYNIAMETKVISSSDNTINSTVLNCSTVTCTNWTIVVCNDDTCETYNKSKHEPFCSQTICTNIAPRIDYIFYYNDAKFINATMKFYTKAISPAVRLISQEINVKFILGNSSIDNVIQLSGNPGYIKGLPMIVSYDKGNHSERFFNSTNKSHYLPYVNNNNGVCFTSNITGDFVLFGVNKRRKCKFEYRDKNNTPKNVTDICKSLQNSIDFMFRLKREVLVAPVGNPFGLKDNKWIPMTKSATDDSPVYGQYYGSNTTIRCFNLITQISYIFVYRDYSEVNDKKKNTIFAALTRETPQNATLNIDDLSVIVTIDTVFIDSSRPAMAEFAGSPHLNIHLPKDFFFPFPSNCSNCFNTKLYVLLSLLLHAYIDK